MLLLPNKGKGLELERNTAVSNAVSPEQLSPIRDLGGAERGSSAKLATASGYAGATAEHNCQEAIKSSARLNSSWQVGQNCSCKTHSVRS